MKTLQEHNSSRMADYHLQNEAAKPHPNGIKCPKCDKELWDSNPMVTLTSSPPQKNVHCPDCGFRGYRLA